MFDNKPKLRKWLPKTNEANGHIQNRVAKELKSCELIAQTSQVYANVQMSCKTWFISNIVIKRRSFDLNLRITD